MDSEYTREDLESFLLGEGDSAVREQISDAILSDPDLDAALREVETDLIDALARGRLSAPRAKAMRRYLGETQQSARLQFAQLLARATKRRRVFWLEAAAALALLTGGGTWFALQRASPPQPIQHATLHLAGEATRGAAISRQFAIPQATQAVDLEIEVAPESADGFRLRILGPTGLALFERSGKPWPQALLRLSVPAAAFSSSALTVELSAVDGTGATTPVAFYDIRIQRE